MAEMQDYKHRFNIINKCYPFPTPHSTRAETTDNTAAGDDYFCYETFFFYSHWKVSGTFRGGRIIQGKRFYDTVSYEVCHIKRTGELAQFHGD